MQIGGVVGVVKNTYRGVITIAFNAASQSATIPAVNTGKTQLRMLGFKSAETSFTSANAPTAMFPMLRLTNSTTITAERQNFLLGDCHVSYELTEFV